VRQVQAFRVRKGGLLSTVQDLGRFQTRRYGLATSGAADKFALQLGNALLGNSFDCAAIEVTLMGLEVEVMADCRIAVSGADLGFRINGRLVQPWIACDVHSGDVLDFIGGREGCRAYLCVKGGIHVPRVFDSRSTDTLVGIGGLGGRPLQAGDVIDSVGDEGPVQGQLRRTARWIRPAILNYISRSAMVRILPGPQLHFFTRAAWQTLVTSEYTVAVDSNRMGIRLDGPQLEHEQLRTDILSEAVPEGALQVPSSGQPIALLADRRTVGGYPKIATAISVDIPRLAQLRPGDTVRFAKVSLEEAQDLLHQQSTWWACIKRCW
jgi:antagonist of KipI